MSLMERCDSPRFLIIFFNKTETRDDEKVFAFTEVDVERIVKAAVERGLKPRDIGVYEKSKLQPVAEVTVTLKRSP
jgi:hypothetical protein